MKEIGGYLEFERNSGREFHADAIPLNSGRNCLRYLLQANRIANILLPKLCCDAVFNVCKEENVEIIFYDVNTRFEPILPTKKADKQWLYVVNTYGFLSGEKVSEMYGKGYEIIWDNSHAFFEKPLNGMHTLYTCRKYFGVPDGGYLYTKCLLEKDLPETKNNIHSMEHLLGRFEENAQNYYQAFQQNEERIEKEPLGMMSKYTQNILRGLDYDTILEIRRDNFEYLKKHLMDINELDLADANGTYMYPLLCKNGAKIRSELQKRKIYVPCLWPNVACLEEKESTAVKLAQNIVPLPIDQRYNEADMNYIVKMINEIIR